MGRSCWDEVAGTKLLWDWDEGRSCWDEVAGRAVGPSNERKQKGHDGLITKTGH